MEMAQGPKLKDLLLVQWNDFCVQTNIDYGDLKPPKSF